jgi:hypothetical protein
MILNDVNNLITQNLKYYIENNLNLLGNNILRYGSESWLNLVNETRELFENSSIQLNKDDQFLIKETDAGLIDTYEGKEVLLDIPWIFEEEEKPLDRPFKTPGHPRKKYAVYTKNDKGKVVLVRFGDPERSVKNHNPVRANAFLKRHHCEEPGPKWKPKWWSCNIGKYHKDVGLQSGEPW